MIIYKIDMALVLKSLVADHEIPKLQNLSLSTYFWLILELNESTKYVCTGPALSKMTFNFRKKPYNLFLRSDRNFEKIC
jgi:hypothetical protein